MINFNTRSPGRTALAGIAAFVVVHSAQAQQAANEFETQRQVFQGSHCTVLKGSQSSRITYNVDWLSNGGNNPSTFVTCPLTRDSIQETNRPPRARVRVYRPNANAPLDCMFVGRTVTGVNYITPGAATVGWSYVDMTLPDTAPGASYAVRCNLPGGARIQKIVLDE